MNWTDSPTCASHAKCARCRDAGALGAAFRAAIRRTFDVPSGEPFPCPHGVETVTGSPSPARLPIPPTRNHGKHCSGCGDGVTRIPQSPAEVEAILLDG